MHIQSTLCSFTPVWMCPESDLTRRQTGQSAAHPDALHPALTRGTLMRVRADETHTLENSAGHSTVSGAHRSPADGRARRRTGGLPGSGRNFASHHQRGLPQRRQRRGGLQEQVRRAVQRLRRPGLAGRLVAAVPLRHRHRRPRAGGSPDRHHHGQGLLPVKGGSNGAVGVDLPAADATATGFNPAGGGGTIILANQASGAEPLATGSVIEPAGVVDLLGYGTSNTFETQAAAAPSGNTDVKSLNRSTARTRDNNAADFTLNAAITPKAATGGAGPGPARRSGPRHAAGAKTIAEIQGEGAASPLAGIHRHHQGQGHRGLPHRRLQRLLHPDPRHRRRPDPATHKASDGIFVYSPATVARVKIGDYVQVTGLVNEFCGRTQLNVAVAAGADQADRGRPRGQGRRLRPPGQRGLARNPRGHAAGPAGQLHRHGQLLAEQLRRDRPGRRHHAAGSAHRRCALSAPPRTPPRSPRTPPAASSSTTAPAPTSSRTPAPGQCRCRA